VTCCHPGYYYSTTNNTCIFNSQYPNLLRPEPDYRYLYLEVLMSTSKILIPVFNRSDGGRSSIVLKKQLFQED